MHTDRYGVAPDRLKGQKSIVDFVVEALKRVQNTETGLRAGHTAIEDGDFVVRNGDIVVSESDDSVVLRIVHGESPKIQMWPLGDDDSHRITMLGYDDPDGAQALVIFVETSPGGLVDGGKLLLTKDFTVLSHQPNSGNESFLWLNSHPVTSEVLIYRGRWIDQGQMDANQGIYCGNFTATSGFSTWTHTYFTPFASNIAPVFTVGVTGTTLSWGIENYSTSSFVMRFSTTSGNKQVAFWNFRL